DLRRRAKLRENFESMRLLYVAATRARDRLILSGSAQKLESIRQDSWLGRVWRELDLQSKVATDEQPDSRVVRLSDDLEIVVSINSNDAAPPVRLRAERDSTSREGSSDLPASLDEAFPLLERIEADRDSAVHRFSVTQLVNFQRCPRQYFFERVLHAP